MKVICNNNFVFIDGEQYEFSDYTFRNEISRGANGVVLEAVDSNLNRPVAIKLWYSKSSDSRDHLLQGKIEATKVASIPHQNIVTVYSAGIIGNCFYLVMELLNGKSLRDVLTSKLPELAFRTKMWSQIVIALRHAHRNSVYHGDLHDRNVLIMDGHIKIIDFGTSFFYTGKKVKAETESLLIIKLCRNIFPEIEPQLRKHDKYLLKNPRLSLLFCDSMVKLISEYEITYSYMCNNKINEHLLLSSLFSIAHACAKCPYIDLDSVIENLNYIGIEKYPMTRFVDQLLVYSELILAPEISGGIHSAEFYCEFGDGDIDRIEKLRNDIRCLYDIISKDGAIELDYALYS